MNIFSFNIVFLLVASFADAIKTPSHNPASFSVVNEKESSR
jgi:hypothetical protein